MFKDSKISVATSGHGNLIFGDSEGNIHLVNRLFQVTTFRAYELQVILAEQLRNAGIFVTVGVSITFLKKCLYSVLHININFFKFIKFLEVFSPSISK